MIRFLQVLLLALSLGLPSSWARLGAQNQMELGNPSGATSDTSNKKNFLIKREEYAESYNNETGEPNWVSWSLTREDTGGSGRSKEFFVDASLPSGFVKVTTETFSGYDRGHMCPSGDRTVSREHNDKTFLMSNMVPQAADNNRGPWEQFESYCRELAFHGEEVLIICGPSGFKGSKSHGVAVPEYTWKIAVTRKPGGTITSSSRVIAIKMPNKNGIIDTAWTDYITSVSEIEKDTGFKFFDKLNASTAEALKVVVDKSATGRGKGRNEKDTIVAVAGESQTSTASTQASIQVVTAPVAPIAPAPPPVVLPDGPKLVVYRKQADGPIETRTAMAKANQDAVEITKEDGSLLILNPHMVLALLPLPPQGELKMTPEQIDLALSQYDKAEKNEAIRSLLLEGHAKWTALKAPAVPEPVVAAPVVASVPAPQPAAKESELDVPTAAGVEEPEIPAWKVWIQKAQQWAGTVLNGLMKAVISKK